MKLNIIPKQEFEVIPSVCAGEDKPFKIKFREPLAGDINPFITDISECYRSLLINCFEGFENKPEIELDGKPYQYFDYQGLINAGSSKEINQIHYECIVKMIEVFNKQQELQEKLGKKSVSAGKSTKAES
ncbi:MAG: hypothetical protein LBK53_09380 [Heliobacteriaceae bacterium]|jgi:hypothetical protein|nr:hypothetical protein [Heliobacteriaceae bacterium]